jgi:integrase
MIDAMRTDGIGSRTTQYVHATLRAALEHAYREELVSRNVAKLVQVERPKPASKEPLTIEEPRKLIDGTTNDRLHALWVLLLMLGLRRSEVCGLRWEHVDFGARTLRISQTAQRVDGKLRGSAPDTGRHWRRGT